MMSQVSEILKFLEHNKLPVVHLATIADKTKPRVRPVSLMFHDRKFYVGTSRKSRKSGEMDAHDAVEFVMPITQGEATGYLRVAGKAVAITNTELVSVVTQTTGYPVARYWSNGVADPDFIMYQVVPNRIEYMPHNEVYAVDVTGEF
jgi:general stress protein 26